MYAVPVVIGGPYGDLVTVVYGNAEAMVGPY